MQEEVLLFTTASFVFVAIVTFVATDFLPRFVLLVVVTGN